MAFNIRNLSAVESTARNLTILIRACRVGGAFYCHDRALTTDVMRKARSLQTSLSKLRVALDDPQHQPIQEDAMPSQPLLFRLHSQPHLYEMARFISYGGKRIEEVREQIARMRARFGEDRVREAYSELTMCDPNTHLTVLRPQVRRLCRGLLGPAPEDPDYQRYYQVNGRTPPAEHQPPPEEAKQQGRGR